MKRKGIRNAVAVVLLKMELKKLKEINDTLFKELSKNTVKRVSRKKGAKQNDEEEKKEVG